MRAFFAALHHLLMAFFPLLLSLRLKTLLRNLGLVLLGGLLLLFIGGWLLSEPRPQGEAGAAADSLAHRMMTAVDCAAWDTTGAVSWVFAGRHRHLWDRQRNYARVQWGDLEVLLDLSTREGIAFESGIRLSPAKAADPLETAWKFWVNDAFWLNAPCKAFDAGTERLLVSHPDGPALLVRYERGGVTPGDAYLWLLGPDFKPEAWRMWVEVIPVGGLEMSWEGWQTLPTGAQLASLHHNLLTLPLTEITGAVSLAALIPGGDPFGPLSVAEGRSVK